ncbi:PREDICTED: MADS-box transcription factor PHERES 1-like [Fragaria vesca subsp. vesca]|uniref:MADS-box transcription factor PHERES 1-like n=1 Tax=Fragaria vesca subsp. vesca TaxID=101020 RepID=UPI0002C2E9EE|nr:PREDICTED: MADS-box transcription factor PHERES 1-like [Fragaria vesca subsp. vesca]
MTFRNMDPQRNKQQLSSSKSDRKKVRDRKKNVFKKAEELSKLCGVDVCLILYQRQSNIAETWPQDPEQVKRIVAGYKANPAIRDASLPSSEIKGLKESRARESDGGHWIKGLKESRARKSSREMLYPTWDDRLDYCTEKELIRLVASLDAKLEASTKRIDSLSRKSSKSGALDHHPMVNSNLNSVPFREINDLRRSSRNYIPSMQLKRSSNMQYPI